MVIGDKGHNVFTQVWALSMEVKPYSCLINIDDMGRGTLNESTNVGVKTGGSRVGGPDLCVKADGNRKQGTQMFTQVRALSKEVIPYFLLD